MTFTDYRTAARMRDVIEEVASGVVDRKRPGYRYAVVDSIDEIKNRANVTFAGEITAVPVRMGAIKPTAGALVRVRGKYGDLHVEDVITGKLGSFSIEDLTADSITSNGDIVFSNNALISNDGGPTNIDHLYHDDTSNVWHFVSDGAYKDPGNSGIQVGTITIRGTPSQMWFIDPDDVANFVIHVNTEKFFLLPDRDGDGSWETPYPFMVDIAPTPEEVRFWHGGGGFTSYIDSDGLFRINRIVSNHGSESSPTYGFSGATAGLYLNSGFLTAVMSGERTLHIATTQLVGIVNAGTGEKNLGNASNRWKGVYATDGTINTSDMGLKDEAVDSDLGLGFVRQLRARKWRWDWGVRPHYGLFAQEVKQALVAVGVQDFAGYIDPAVDWEYNPDDPQLSGEQPGPLGLRYHEFIGPIIKAIQELADRVDVLEGS